MGQDRGGQERGARDCRGGALPALVCCGIALLCAGTAWAGVPPTGVTDQAALLHSDDPKLAANKKLVFDMWRAIIQGGHTELAPKFFTRGYIQHNPNVATGRDAMVAFMKSTRPVKPIAPDITFPVVAIMAEGDLVMVATVSYSPDPENPGHKYAGTHFDLFRIENGRIAEHWDSVPKDPAMLHYNPNTQSKP
ncbi:MAG TPA: ester cyclase [Steroidobacteraceae bacterium]|nr:ester cyclase [Steroidobacteraceae bacterium]